MIRALQELPTLGRVYKKSHFKGFILQNGFFHCVFDKQKGPNDALVYRVYFCKSACSPCLV